MKILNKGFCSHQSFSYILSWRDFTSFIKFNAFVGRLFMISIFLSSLSFTPLFVDVVVLNQNFKLAQYKMIKIIFLICCFSSYELKTVNYILLKRRLLLWLN